MNITIGIYSISNDNVIIKKPFEIIGETEKCYFAGGNHRYLKSQIGKPILRSRTSYPYVELVMVDADADELQNGLKDWFISKACKIWREMKGEN